MFKQQLTARGLLFSKGTIVDGSFIEAPSSTKNADKKRDPEMRSAKKGSNRQRIGVDKATGIIHTVVTTPANVHDVTKADELRRPDDWEVIGDSGYLGMEKRDSADPERVTYTAAKRYSQRKKLSAERIADEKLLSSIRCKVEHAFH
ncbi:transposase [Parasutterella sp.]|uniref:transposase n=1 Tax=Parasutterella sp. TaxID=2049037 RepID=UPI00351FD956